MRRLTLVGLLLLCACSSAPPVQQQPCSAERDIPFLKEIPILSFFFERQQQVEQPEKDVPILREIPILEFFFRKKRDTPPR